MCAGHRRQLCTAKSRQAGHTFECRSSSSTNATPDPTAMSFAVLDTRVSLEFAKAPLAAMWTTSPPKVLTPVFAPTGVQIGRSSVASLPVGWPIARTQPGPSKDAGSQPPPQGCANRTVGRPLVCARPCFGETRGLTRSGCMPQRHNSTNRRAVSQHQLESVPRRNLSTTCRKRDLIEGSSRCELRAGSTWWIR